MPRLGQLMSRALWAVVPALAIGLVIGVISGIAVAGRLDTTPYGEAEFNTAARNAHQAGRLEGMDVGQAQESQAMSQLRADHAKQVGALMAQREAAQTSVRHLRDLLNRMRETSARRQGQMAQLQRALEESDDALDRAMNRAAGPAEDAIKGKLRSTWVLTRRDKPWPTGCAQALDAYEIRVTAGADATVGHASLVSAQPVARRVRNRTLTLTCAIAYAVDIPTPLGSWYRFTVTDSTRPKAPAKSTLVPATALRTGIAPPLTVTR